MRIVILGPMLASVMLTAVPAAIDVSPVFIWNASASVPIGLYHVLPEDHLARGRSRRRHATGADREVSCGPQLFAARRAAFEARARTSRSDRLPHPSRHSDRWRRDGDGSRA